MIQGAINQLLGVAAAAKKASDIAKAKETKATAKGASKAQQAKIAAIQRMQNKVQERWDQSEAFKKHLAEIGGTNAPDIVKQLGFEKWKETPKDVRIGGSKVDVSKLSPEAQKALREGVHNG